MLSSDRSRGFPAVALSRRSRLKRSLALTRIADRNFYPHSRTVGVRDDFISIVPFYIDFGKGNMTREFDRTMELPGKPKAVLVNAHYENLSLPSD